ncbi:NEL-type E3 ubiquitin ligase domain-containing protein, partial [Endozoicomonas sp. ONNA2]|uniref:NEL-type E3 ubiquitin ligase domain-containing protein n=1 Tax=Endozoicomonas sp. ONNA2 TaxID=2828741 RepID=UPI0021497726
MNTNAVTSGTTPAATTSSPVDNNCSDYNHIDNNHIDNNHGDGQRYIPQPEKTSYPPETVSLEDRIATEVITVTPDEMKELILLGNFSDDIHYRVEGNLELDKCPAAALPGQLTVTGNFFLTDCIHLKHLSGKLTVYDDFCVSGSTDLETLSGKIHIKGDCELKNRPNLKSLSGDLTFDGILDLTQCRKLSELPEKLTVKKSLILNDCEALSELPDGLDVGEALSIRRCTGLRKLPENLSALELHLDECTGLGELPDTLCVGGNVSLDGCISLRCLPQNPFFRANLSLNGCRGLTAMPNWITELGRTNNDALREVHLFDTGLSDALYQRLSGMPPPEGMLFYYDMGRGNPVHAFTTLQEGLDFWRELASTDTETPALDLRSDPGLIEFLGRLTGTADYQNLNSRPVLAQRVMAVMSLLADNDQFRDDALGRLSHAGTSCDDRVILALDDLETMQLLTSAQTLALEMHDPTELKALGRQMMILEKIKAIASAHMKTLTLVDEIEVELTFRIELGRFFKFPGSTQNMLFRECALVNDEDIARARVNIEESCTDAALEDFLAQWEPWQKFQRVQAVRPF